MADDLKNSEIETRNSRTKSLIGSFKMAQSLLIPGSNKKIVNLEVKGLKLIDKNQYKKQQACQVCFIGFSKLTRQHHCRVCANAVCSACSGSSINKQRSCDVCAYKYSLPDLDTSKTQILYKLQQAAILYAQQKNALQQQLKKINEQANDLQATQKSIESSQRKISELQKQIEQMRKKKSAYELQIKQIEG